MQFQYELCGDASQKGLFCFQYSSSEEVVLRRLLTSDEKKKSSTFREMLVLHEVYAKSSIEKYSGLVLRHLVDNQAVMWIMSVGSRNPELQIMVKEIFLNCRKWDVRLVVEWRSRDDPLLKIADVGSKDFDDSCYSLDFESFSALMDFFSHLRLDVDAMAHDWNKKCENFFSRLYDSRALGINFFAQKLDMASSYYIFPPPSVITGVILHLQRFQVSGLLLVPFWPSVSFWCNLVPDGVHLPIWAKRFLIFRPSGFLWDPVLTSTAFKNPPQFDMLAVEFNFSGLSGQEIFTSGLNVSCCLSFGCNLCS